MVQFTRKEADRHGVPVRNWRAYAKCVPINISLYTSIRKDVSVYCADTF